MALQARQPPLGDIAVAAIAALVGVVAAAKWPPVVGIPVMLGLCAGVLALTYAWPNPDSRAALRKALRLGRPNVGLLVACLPILMVARASAVVWEAGLKAGADAVAHPPVGLLVAGLLVAPILEEILFRGCLLSHIASRWGLWPGVVGSAVVFSAMHWVGWPLVLDVFLAGILLALTVVASGSLWAGVAGHIAVNATASALDRAGWPSDAASVPSGALALATATGASALVVLLCWHTIRKAAEQHPA